MLKLESKLIEGTKPSAKALERIKEEMQLPDGISINLMVFEVNYDNKKYYCCWSGGEIRNGTLYLTPVGQAAMEALTELPIGNNNTLIIQELRLGETPLKAKVKKALKKAGANSKICFVGDMAGELDGHMAQAFNLVSGTVKVSH